MNRNIVVKCLNPDFKDITMSLEIPGKCPRCKTAFSELPLTSHFINVTATNRSYTERFIVYSLFFCPHCEQCFMTEHLISEHDVCHPRSFTFRCYPESRIVKDFPAEVATLSPDFIRIYNQSEKAESAGLNEICGIGYRKALEFLVKDFAIHRHPEDETVIKNQPLATCIKTYIPDDPIKNLTMKSAWLGNDHTHYVCKHEDRDLGDLKRFVEAAVYFISMTLVSEDAASM